jgi:hypothetical protein
LYRLHRANEILNTPHHLLRLRRRTRQIAEWIFNTQQNRKEFDMPKLKIAPLQYITSIVFTVAILVIAEEASAQSRTGTVLDIEVGAAWQDRNDVQMPNDSNGTRFALDGVTGSGPFFAPRIQLSTTLAPRHELRLLAAPLGIKESGSLDKLVKFEGQTFAAGGVEARYRFNSYRATWRYTLYENPDWMWKAGVTGKIRDAEITLRQGDVTATRSNIGFVPLLHLYGERRLDNRSRLIFDGDGLAGGPGRAFDLSARYVREIDERVSVFAGLRVLDGGADSSSGYNFARFHYLTFGLQYGM